MNWSCLDPPSPPKGKQIFQMHVWRAGLLRQTQQTQSNEQKRKPAAVPVRRPNQGRWSWALTQILIFRALGSQRKTVSSAFASIFSRELVPTVFEARTESTPFQPTTITIPHPPDIPSSSFNQKQSTYNLCKPLLPRSIHGFTRFSWPSVVMLPFTCSLSAALPPLILYLSQSLSSCVFSPLSFAFVNHGISGWGVSFS